MATESIRFDPRELLSLFEVHYWQAGAGWSRNTGRVMVIHVPSGDTSHGAIITDMRITGPDSAAMTVAHALANFGEPNGMVYVHTSTAVFHESLTMRRTRA